MSKLFICALSAAALIAVASPAAAQMACGDRAEIVAALGGKYQEKPRALGLVGDKFLVELFTSKEGSWTVLMSKPRGVTCILATGLNWEELPPDKQLTGL